MEKKEEAAEVDDLHDLDDILDEFEDTSEAQLEDEFQKLLEESDPAVGADAEHTGFASEISQIMDRLSEADVEGGGSLTELMQLLHTALGDGDTEETGESGTTSALDSLNIKDILLGPINQLDSLYNDWLEAHSGAPKPQYTKQAEIIRHLKKKLEDTLFNENEPSDQEFVMEKLKEVCAQSSMYRDICISNPRLSYKN